MNEVDVLPVGCGGVGSLARGERRFGDDLVVRGVACVVNDVPERYNTCDMSMKRSCDVTNVPELYTINVIFL